MEKEIQFLDSATALILFISHFRLKHNRKKKQFGNQNSVLYS